MKTCITDPWSESLGSIDWIVCTILGTIIACCMNSTLQTKQVLPAQIKHTHFPMPEVKVEFAKRAVPRNAWHLTPQLIIAIGKVESGGNRFAFEKRTHARGKYQIRMGVVRDVNRVFHTRFTASDCFNNERSIAIMGLWFDIKKPTSDLEATCWWNRGVRRSASHVRYYRKIVAAYASR